MPVHLDNPAGRLHAVFSRLHAVPVGMSLDEAWARTLGCDESDLSRVGEEMCEVAGLLHECIAAARSLEASGDTADLLHYLPQWSSAIFGFRRHRGAQVKPVEILPQPAMSSLATLAMTLHIQVPERTFKAEHREELDAALQQLRELKDEIVTEELLPEPIRARLLKVLGEALDSFRFLQFRGDERLAYDLEAARQALELPPESRSLCTEGVLDRIDRCARRVSAIAQTVWSSLATPVGAIYVLASGDVMGGATIMAANPRVADAISQIGSAIRVNTKQSGDRQIQRAAQDEPAPRPGE